MEEVKEVPEVNYKSDFDFYLILRTCDGKEIGWPEYDWTARLYTSTKANAFVVSCIGGECTNCYRDGNRIHIVANNHHLSAGGLHVEFVAEIPNETYPDGSKRVVTAELLEVNLVKGRVCPSTFEVELMLPYIKGEPFTYADFTPEQIAELQRPATEAANQLETFEAETTQTLNKAEAARETAESKRVTAEETRQRFEKERAEAEAKRNRAEFARNEAEESRIQAETARVQAEQARATAEEAREEAERKREEALISKADRSELSNIYGEEFLLPKSIGGAVPIAPKYKLMRLIERSILAEPDSEDGAGGATVYPLTVSTQVLMLPTKEDLSAYLARVSKIQMNAISARQEALVDSQDIRIVTSGAAIMSASEDVARSSDFAPYLELTDRARRAVFDDLFLAAAGTWGRIDHTHTNEDGTPSPYYLNELWLTYEEAVAIYNAYVKTDSKCSTNYTGVNIRTNLPFGTSYITSLGQMFQGCKMEVIRVGCAATTSYAAFASCANARKIYGIIIDGSFPAAQDFIGCVKLETLEISRLKKSLILSDSPLLSAYSVNYIVTKAANTTAITITLHADVYNKIVEAAESDTESEWSGLLELAASKNITFASA